MAICLKSSCVVMNKALRKLTNKSINLHQNNMICKSNSIVILLVVILNLTLISSMNSDQKIQPRSGVLVTFKPATPEPEKFYINRRNFEVNFDLTTFEFFSKTICMQNNSAFQHNFNVHFPLRILNLIW